MEAELPTPDDIDGSFVPRQHPDVLELPVGPQIVIVRDRAHALNPIAALIWQCLDGEGTIDEIVADLAEATGADPDVVEADVLALTRQLAGMGLLEGVAAAPGFALRASGPESLAVGAQLEPFVLPSLDGDEIALEAFRGRRVLLVNWSPGCGFCLKIADELGGLQAGLDEAGISLVFVTTGDAEANRAVFADAGLGVPALLRRGGVDPFHGFGTPAAYLLDEDGNVAAPMALGANHVPGFVRDLAGVDTHGSAASSPVAMYLPASAAVCGGGAVAAPSKGTTWEGTRAYRFGDFHVGIRYNDASTADVLDRLFAGQQVGDERTPDNYSVALYPQGGRTRELNLLVKGAQQLIRSRSTIRVLQGLLAYLSDELTPRDGSLLRLSASAVVGDGKAMLGPAAMVNWVKELQPRLSRARLQLVDVPAVTVDAATGELVIPEPTVDHDPGTLRGLDDGVTLGSELPPMGPGRYPLRAWLIATAPDRAGTMAPALRVAGAVPLVSAPKDLLPNALTDLVTLLEQVEAIGIWFDSPASLAKQMAAFVN